MDGVGLLQTGSIVLLNSAYAWICGALFSAWCLRHAAFPSTWLVWRSSALAACACLAGALLALWCACALMADVRLGPALGMLVDMLMDTAYGRAGLVSTAAMAAVALITVLRPGFILPAMLLLVFALARASMSHAAEHGVVSVGTMLEAIHLLFVALWAGVVAVAGWMVLPKLGRAGKDTASYLAAVSSAATLALTGIVATGAWNAWQRIETLEQMTSHTYGMTLSVKLGLFALAACLGAWNRFVGFPSATSDPARAIAVLRIESLVLLAAFVAAAVLTLQEPPR